MGDVLNRGTKDRPRWYCRYVDVDGKRKQKATHQPTKVLAQQYLAAIEARIARGEVGIVEPTPEERARKTITVAELARHFLGDVDGEPGYAPPRIKNLTAYRGDARSALEVRVLPTLGMRAASEVSTADVERMRDALLASKRKAATVTHALAILSKLYNWSRKVELIDCANPVVGVERPRAHASIDFLDKAEVANLLAIAEDLSSRFVASASARMLYAMLATAIYTGMRKGELFGLRWRDVVFDASRIDVNRSYRLAPKSGKARHVPLHPDLAVILRKWREGCWPSSEDLVFPVEGEPDQFRMGIERDMLGISELLALAGCHLPADGKPWHMMRHTFAAHAVMSGASLYAVQKLLGHASPMMTQRYAHLAPDYLATEIARITFVAPAAAGTSDMARSAVDARSPPIRIGIQKIRSRSSLAFRREPFFCHRTLLPVATC